MSQHCWESAAKTPQSCNTDLAENLRHTQRDLQASSEFGRLVLKLNKHKKTKKGETTMQLPICCKVIWCSVIHRHAGLTLRPPTAQV